MISVLKRFSLCLLLIAQNAAAAERKAGDFDYYVLALSWNASWCAAEGDARDAEQCDPKYDFGFLVHGLWPQFENGWPSFCQTTARDPSRRQTAAMADVMGSGGSAWNQWKKHGRCTGLTADAFFELTRDAFAKINRPAILRRVEKPLRISPSVIEEAFLSTNPDLTADGVTITCQDGRIREARICLTRDLKFRQCAPDVRRDCGAKGPIFPPIK